jgi:Leucine-rich repeat (LRR) protein
MVLKELESLDEYGIIRLLNSINYKTKLGYTKSKDRITGIVMIWRQLQKLPENIGKLTGLKKLELSDNHLKSLPDSIGDLASVKYHNCLDINFFKFCFQIFIAI